MELLLVIRASEEQPGVYTCPKMCLAFIKNQELCQCRNIKLGESLKDWSVSKWLNFQSWLMNWIQGQLSGCAYSGLCCCLSLEILLQAVLEVAAAGGRLFWEQWLSLWQCAWASCCLAGPVLLLGWACRWAPGIRLCGATCDGAQGKC